MGPDGWRESDPGGPAEWSLLVATLRGTNGMDTVLHSGEPVELRLLVATLRGTSEMGTACGYTQGDQLN